MPFCSLCPGRSFKHDDAVQMHWESKHSYTCSTCSKVLGSQNALEQHTRDKHSFFECEHCDREFTTDEGRLAHQKAQHPPMFECHFCNREFTTCQGRDAHEEAKHHTFECHHCDREFDSEEACQQHEDAKHHPKFHCQYCNGEFSSENARQQHELAKHYFECVHCGKSFTQVKSLRQHEKTTPHIECNYCTMEFFTQDTKNGHEKTCSRNPINRVVRIGLTSSNRPLRQPNTAKSTKSVDEESSVSAVTQHTDDGSESSSFPSRSFESTLDEGEIHPTRGIRSTVVHGGATTEQPCTCSICQRPSPSSLNTDKPVPDDVEIVVPTDDKRQDGSVDLRSVTFRCTLCLEVFETEEALRDHICASRIALFRPHCRVCYTQFDDELLLQEHMKCLQSFPCHLCLARCCSDEILQDHLSSHPTCGKCGKSFADDLALCAHVESGHPVVVCWDCDGIVVEKDSLELHYADSSAHPSCGYCGLGKRNSAEMDEHIRHAHAPDAEMEDDDNVKASPNGGLPSIKKRTSEVDLEEAARQPLEVDRAPPLALLEAVGPLDGLGDLVHNNPLQMESSPFLLPQSPMPPRVEHINEAAVNLCAINGKESPDVYPRQYATPSSTPSEHGSDASRLQLPASKPTIIAADNNTRPPSSVSSVSAELFPDTSIQNSSIVSAEGMPDYIRENTSEGSLSSGCIPLRLSSSSSLESLEIVKRIPKREERAQVVDDNRNTGMSNVANRLHCRICLLDPCEDMTATICGHLFCRKCITQAVVAKSECPVCKCATLLYCLFKLDLSV